METSDWLSLLAIIISFYAIYLGKLSEKRAKKIDHAQKTGQVQLSMMNVQLKIESQILKYTSELSRTDPASDRAAILKRTIEKASALVEQLDQQTKKLFGAKVIDEVGLEEVMSLAKMAERNAEHIESLPL
jgi:hypothetical protein